MCGGGQTLCRYFLKCVIFCDVYFPVSFRGVCFSVPSPSSVVVPLSWFCVQSTPALAQSVKAGEKKQAASFSGGGCLSSLSRDRCTGIFLSLCLSISLYLCRSLVSPSPFSSLTLTIWQTGFLSAVIRCMFTDAEQSKLTLVKSEEEKAKEEKQRLTREEEAKQQREIEQKKADAEKEERQRIAREEEERKQREAELAKAEAERVEAERQRLAREEEAKKQREAEQKRAAAEEERQRLAQRRRQDYNEKQNRRDVLLRLKKRNAES